MTIKIVFILLSFLKSFESLQEIYPFLSFNNCTNTEYFDVESMKCTSCDSGFSKDESGMTCGCFGTNKYTKFLNNSSKLECLQCKPNEYVSNDKSTCVPRNCFNIGNGKITCSVCKKDQIIVTNSLNGSILSTVECITCLPGYSPSSDRTSCQPCIIKTSGAAINTCDCDKTKSTMLNSICVPNAFAKNLTSLQLKNKLGENVNSDFIDKYWITSNYLCSIKNITACQMVANMCALSLYHNDNEIVCKFSRNAKHNGLPVLMYGEDESYSVLYRKKIGIVYTLSPDSENHYIKIYTRGINIYGSIEDHLNTESLPFYPCPIIWKSFGSHILKFAENYKHKCSIGVQQLMSASQPLFYEPYLKYIDKESKDSISQLYTIPVLIRGNLIRFNKENDVNTWQFVRRFFIIDKSTGEYYVNGVKNYKYIRYASRIQINIRIRQKGIGERNKIYPPLLVIDYDEISENAIKNNEHVNLEFAINFEMDGSGLINGMEISVGSLSAFVVLYSVLQSWSYARRSGKLGFDPHTLLQFFIFSSANLSNTFFIVSFGASVYSFIIYKTQKAVYVIPPSVRDEYMIRTYVIVAFTLKIVEILVMNWRQINIDISFVDWDKPILTASEHNVRRPQAKMESHVSFWRPYFVANEWNELQTMRKISLPLLLVCCVIVIEIFGASSWANIGIQVDSEQSMHYLSSSAYQFALSGLIFISLYCTQLGISIFVYERYIKNAVLDFMDVCSIANVSMLILDETLFGYYLHGRSAHTSCNSDIRGLQAGLPHRAFSVRCTADFRMYYSRLCIHMASKNVKWQWQHHLSNGADQMNVNASETGMESSRKHSGKSSKKDSDCNVSVTTSLPPVLEHREQASKLINKFLTAFFDHALEDLDYEVREKRFIERLLDIEMVNDGNHKTVLMYNATGDSQSFQRAIWYGQEWTLATFDLYLFCLVQITTGNYVLAALINGVIWKSLSIIRQFLGQKNLAKKTLIDERFLI